jgi:hypothetical protein
MMSKIIKLFFYYGSFLENTRHRRRATLTVCYFYRTPAYIFLSQIICTTPKELNIKIGGKIFLFQKLIEADNLL